VQMIFKKLEICSAGDRMHPTDNPGGICSGCLEYIEECRTEFYEDQMEGLREGTRGYIG